MGPLRGCLVKERHFASQCAQCKVIWAAFVARHETEINSRAVQPLDAVDRAQF